MQTGIGAVQFHQSHVTIDTATLEHRIASLERDARRSKRLTGIAIGVAIAAMSMAAFSTQAASAQTGQSIMADTIFARSIFVGTSPASTQGVLISADSKSATVSLTSAAGSPSMLSLTANQDAATVEMFDRSGNAAALGYRPDAPGAVRAYPAPTTPGQNGAVWSAP